MRSITCTKSWMFILCVLIFKNINAKESAVDVLVKWNNYHNNQELNSFQKLYHDSVFYYGKKVSNDYCSNSKSKALSGKAYSQYLQNVQERTIGKYFIRLDFEKVVTYNGKTNSYPSYLVLRRGEEGLKICVEGDKITDRTLLQKYRSDIPNDYITGDFDGDGLLEKAWVVRPTKMNPDIGGCENGCYVTIKFSDISIPNIRAHGIGGTLKNLGDLNGNGLDELGMERWWFQSCWQPYYIFTNVHYKWMNPITIDSHCDQPMAPVNQDDETGEITLNTAVMNEETNWTVGVISTQIIFPEYR